MTRAKFRRLVGAFIGGSAVVSIVLQVFCVVMGGALDPHSYCVDQPFGVIATAVLLGICWLMLRPRHEGRAA